jgi:hypothetical protein
MTDKIEELWKKAFKPTIIGEREIQMVGQDVAVVRNTREEVSTETIKGKTYTHRERVGCGDLYIDFVWLRQDSTVLGELYEDEDSIGDGGFGVESAESLISQLQAAIFALKLRKP